MVNLSWEDLLRGQQEEFIQRLKTSLHLSQHGLHPIQLNTLDWIPGLSGFTYEQINLSLPNEEIASIQAFCDELAYKYAGEYDPDCSINHQIGKIGEEAVKQLLGDLSTPVDYELHDGGDGGTDFFVSGSPPLKIQVKTRSLSRITLAEAYQLSHYDIIDTEMQALFNSSELLDSATWEISESERQKNDILICVLLLNFIPPDGIASDVPRCIMAGFKPTTLLGNTYPIGMKDLLYIGGLFPYLKAVNQA